MELWTHSWKLSKQELKRQRTGFIVSLVFNLYMACIGGAIANGMLSNQGSVWDGRIAGILCDLMLFAAVINLGFVFSKDYFNYWKQDSFTKRMAFLRRLPIRCSELVFSRVQLSAIFMLFNVLFFFPLYYAVAAEIREELSVFGILDFTFALIGVSFAAAGLFIMVELTVTGKKYLAASMVCLVVFLLCSLIGMFFDTPLSLGVIRLVQDYGLGASALFLLLGAGIWRFCYRRTIARIQDRDFR